MKDIELTEKEFDQFMLLNGFTRVASDIGNSPKFANADYVNKERRIIVELKILNKEFFSNGGMIDSLNAMIIQPKSIDENGLGQYTFSLPDRNREGKHDNFEEPLRRTIKKANEQIKKTKQNYFVEKPCLGFVILAQVGLTSLGADVTALVVKKILNHEFRSVDGAIVCVPYNVSKNPTTLKINPQCVSVTREDNFVKKAVCMELADKWIEFWETGEHKQ